MGYKSRIISEEDLDKYLKAYEKNPTITKTYIGNNSMHSVLIGDLLIYLGSEAIKELEKEINKKQKQTK